MFDVLIQGGRLVTGVHDAVWEGDIGIQGGVITAMAPRLAGHSKRIVSADGMYVCPGLIDTHSHSDLEMLRHPDSAHKIKQGVTTEVIGNCGFSLYPVSAQYVAEAMDLAGLIFHGIERAELFADAEAYGRRLGKTSVNLLPLVGHNMLRVAVNGNAAHLPEAGLQELLDLLSVQLNAGISGVSTGLLYTPACYAGADELVRLAGALKREGKVLACHMRDEGNGVESALAEMTRVAAQSGVSIMISHLKASGKANWGKMPTLLNMVEHAAANGCSMTFDCYPYRFGNTALVTLLPLREIGVSGAAVVTDSLRDASIREQLCAAMMLPDSMLMSIGADNIVISDSRHAAWMGKTLAQAAQIAGKTVCDFIVDAAVAEQGQTGLFLFQMDENDVRLALKHPRGCLASDGIPSSGNMPHPRWLSAFLHFLGHYVFQERLCDLSAAVRKMTALPAELFKLTDRGRLAVGCVADICVFNAARIRGIESWQAPRMVRGMDYVMVGGEVVVEETEYTGSTAGSLLRSIL